MQTKVSKPKVYYSIYVCMRNVISHIIIILLYLRMLFYYIIFTDDR